MLGQSLRAVSLAAGVIVLVVGGVGSSSALPVSSGLRLKGDAGASGSPIQKVHGWHCRRRYGWVRHCHRRYCHTHPRWHRHRRACYRYRGYYYGPYIYIGPRSYRRRYRRFRRYRAPRRYYRHRGIRRGRARGRKLRVRRQRRSRAIRSYPFPYRETVRGRARARKIPRGQRPDP